MAWTTITEDQVRSQLSEAELAAMRTLSLQGGATDPLIHQITHVTDYVRGFVRQVMDLEAAGVPPSLVVPAIDIIVYRILQRVAPTLAEKRKPLYDEALRLLDKVAKGDFDPTDGVTANDAAIGFELVCYQPRVATRPALAGL